MYTPKVNAETDVATLHHFMRQHPLCALVTHSTEGLIASHIPMVLHEDGSPFGMLRGHVVRANSQWQTLTASEDALAIFTGPQHYISASWYPDKHEHGREVPTWNYVAVHAYGPIRIHETKGWLLKHLSELTDRNEVIAETPWRVADAPPEFIEKLTRGIVGIEMPITGMEGKWKVSQNRNERDAEGVMEGLGRLETFDANTMKALVKERRPR